MLGGLARRAALVEKVRGEGQVLVVDSGDLFFSPTTKTDSERALAKARLLARVYKKMGAAAVNVGDLDLLHGLGFLRQEASQGLPLISANLIDGATKKPLFHPYVLKQALGARIALFGLLSPQLRPEVRESLSREQGEKILIKDPTEAAREMVAQLRGQADLILLLSDLGLQGDTRLAKEVPGIHFIFGGHDGRYLVQPNQQGKTYILQSYAKGMYAGKLQIALENPGHPFRDRGRKDWLREELKNLDLHLQALREEQQGRHSRAREKQIQLLTENKARLETQLSQSSNPSPSENQFSWTLVPLNSALPEDPEVQRWIKDGGIDRE